MPVRMLLIGDSGTGKTSALLPLLKAGFKINLADFDNGTDYLKAKCDAEMRKRLSVKTFTDRMNRIGSGDKQVESLVTPSAISRFGSALDKWDGDGLASWDANTIFVLDSMTFCARAFAKQFQSMNNLPINKPLTARDFGPIQGMIQNFLDRLHDDRLQCHYIVISHIDWREYREDTYVPVGIFEKTESEKPKPGKVSPEEVEVRGVPTVFGAKLGPQIGRYFNYMLQVRTETIGTKTQPFIFSKPNGTIDLKCPTDHPKLPLESGLLTIFNARKEAQLD